MTEHRDKGEKIMANQQLKETKISAKVVGVLTEKALELETGVKKTSNKDGKQYVTDVIKGKLVVDGFEIRVYSQSKTAKGDNKMFKGIKTIYNDYIDKLMASKDTSLTADTISVDIKYECNDYVGQDGEVKTGTQISLFKADRVSPDTAHQAEVDIDGAVIRKIAPIIKNEEETGEYTVEIATFDYNGKLKPFTFVVDEDLAERFMDMYEAGQTTQLYAEIKAIQIGGEANETKKAAFGKKAKVQSGFTIMQHTIIGGEKPFDEENSYDLADVKKAMYQREEELEAMKKKAKEEGNKKSSGGGLKGNGKTGGKGIELGKKPNVDEQDDMPF